jgi:hypothetical protein
MHTHFRGGRARLPASTSILTSACGRSAAGLLVLGAVAGLGCQKGDDATGAEATAEVSAEIGTRTSPLGAAAADGLDALSPEQLAERMLTVTKADQMSEQMIEAMRQQLSALPEAAKHLDDMKPMLADMQKRIIPVYVKHLTKAEMIALIRFYESTTGQTVMEKMPLIMGESMQIAQSWAQEVIGKARSAAAAPQPSLP